MDVPKHSPEQRVRLCKAFIDAGYWVDTPEAMDGLLNIAEEFNLSLGALAGVWSRFPNKGYTESRALKQGEYGWEPMRGHHVRIVSTISQSRYDELRALLRKFGQEHEERQAQAKLHASRVTRYQYEVAPSFEGMYGEYGERHASPDRVKQVQGRAVIDKLFDLVEHAEKAEAGREKAELSRERLLEELRGLRLELGQLSRPSRSNTDRTFYVACGCLGVLVLMLFFK